MALVIQATPQRQSIPVTTILLVLLAAFVLHIPFLLVKLFHELPPVETAETAVTIDLSSLPDLPAQTQPAQKPPEKNKPAAQPAVAEAKPQAQPQPEAQKPQEPQPKTEAAKKEETQKPEEKKEEPAKPQPEEKAEQKQQPIPAPPAPGTEIAFATSKPDAEAPKDPKYLSDRNSIASDHGPKNLPIGDPFNAKGDTEIVRNVGRRGETEDKNAKLVDPLTGSVTQTGTPLVGNPDKPDLSLAPRSIAAKEPLPVEKKAPSPDAEKLAPKPETIANAPKIENKPPDKPLTPQSTGGVTGTGGSEKKNTTETALPLEGPAAKQKDDLTKLAGDKLDKPAPGAPVPNPVNNAAAQHDPEKAPSEGTKPEAKTALEKPIDPELAKIMGLTAKGGSSGAQNTLKNPGQGTRAGQVGQEGNGNVRPGESDAVSDVVTMNLNTRAGKEGEVKFAAAGDPVVAYLKPFFQRMDQKWKAEVAVSKMRLELGSVAIRISFDRTGRLIEATEVQRMGDISDYGVNLCRKGIQAAAPHDFFPPNLGTRDRVTVTVGFNYGG